MLRLTTDHLENNSSLKGSFLIFTSDKPCILTEMLGVEIQI